MKTTNLGRSNSESWTRCGGGGGDEGDPGVGGCGGRDIVCDGGCDGGVVVDVVGGVGGERCSRSSLWGVTWE